MSYVCPVCGRRFGESGRFYAHVAEHVRELARRNVAGVALCPVCGQPVIASTMGLLAHCVVRSVLGGCKSHSRLKSGFSGKYYRVRAEALREFAKLLVAADEIEDTTVHVTGYYARLLKGIRDYVRVATGARVTYRDVIAMALEYLALLLSSGYVKPRTR